MWAWLLPSSLHHCSRSGTSPKDNSEATRPNGSCLFSSTTGPAAHVTPSVLAESLGPAPHLASGTPQSQGDPQLQQGLGPLESSPSVPVRDRSGAGLQKESSHDRCLKIGLRCPV